MINLRENLGQIIGSAVAGIVAFLSWFYESGLLSTLVGIVIGAGITYFVQTRTQKRVWKREYTLETIEKVYGPLFEEIDQLLRYMTMETYSTLSTPKWQEIKSTYRYLMLDEDFKRRTEQFYKRVGVFNKTLIKILREVLDTIVKEEAEEFLGFKPKTIDLIVKGRRFNAWTSLKVDIPLTLLKRKQPIEMVADLYPELKKLSFHLEIMNPSGNPYSYTHPEWMKEFDKFWKRSSKRLEANDTVKTVKRTIR